MASYGRKGSFDVLGTSLAGTDDEVSMSSSSSNPPQNVPAVERLSPKRKKKKKKSRKPMIRDISFAEGVSRTVPDVEMDQSCFSGGFGLRSYAQSVVETAVVLEAPEGRSDSFVVCTATQSPRLRQRNVNSGISAGSETEVVMSSVTEDSRGNDGNENEDVRERGNEAEELQQQRVPVEMNQRSLEKAESLDWKQLMNEDPINAYPLERSPMKYFLEEMHTGNSLSSTVSLGSEKDREKVYDTIFRLPWRCELVITVGFFVCIDSFLSLLTIMPTRFTLILWRLLKTRQFKKPTAAELSDLGCFIVLISGVALLQQIDISMIYHIIRGQGTIKLYVVYNILEIFDKLFQNFVGDVMQTLFNTAEGLANCPPEGQQYWLWRFISDEALAMATSIVHSFVLIAQGTTLSTCVAARNNALFPLLVSNNFAEIKSNVFKRFSKDNIRSLVYFDSIERFHISAFLLFVLAQNIREDEGPWFKNFLFDTLVVFVSEMLIDIIKHSFIAKFNDIKPVAFSEYLEDLCQQTLRIQTENGKKGLVFVPLAPACVVIRVLQPVYSAHLPCGPLPWRLFWIFLLSAMTYVMLSSLKLLIGMSLKKHARWYIKRCQKRKLHSD